MSSEWLSVYWFAPLAAYATAQVAKVVIGLARNQSEPRPTLLSSGNMPSSHSAIVIALLVVVGVEHGLDSAVFGIAAVLAAIVIYDALNVRRAVGEQGEVLGKLTKGTPFFTAIGHKPLEVVAGSALGLLTAVVVLQIL